MEKLTLELDATLLAWLEKFAKNKRFESVAHYIIYMMQQHKDWVLKNTTRKIDYRCDVCKRYIGLVCTRLYIMDSVTFKTRGIPKNSEYFDEFFSQKIFPSEYTPVFKIRTCEHLKEHLPEEIEFINLESVHKKLMDLVRLGVLKKS